MLDKYRKKVREEIRKELYGEGFVNINDLHTPCFAINQKFFIFKIEDLSKMLNEERPTSLAQYSVDELLEEIKIRTGEKMRKPKTEIHFVEIGK